MEKRHPALPGCPTLKEQGFNLVSGAYRGIAVPNTAPKAVQQAVSDLIGKINKEPAFVKAMEEKGFAMIDVGLADMPAFMAARQKEYEDIARDMGILKK
jgi:tripartite-type tricarboxylate transporter receptor subunit TctC